MEFKKITKVENLLPSPNNIKEWAEAKFRNRLIKRIKKFMDKYGVDECYCEVFKSPWSNNLYIKAEIDSYMYSPEGAGNWGIEKTKHSYLKIDDYKISFNEVEWILENWEEIIKE